MIRQFKQPVELTPLFVSHRARRIPRQEFVEPRLMDAAFACRRPMLNTRFDTFFASRVRTLLTVSFALSGLNAACFP